MSVSQMNIETIKSAVDTAGGFLFGSKYIVSFVGVGSIAQSIFGNTDMSMYANSVTTPALSISTEDANILGQKVTVPKGYDEDTITVSFYNTGTQYKVWYNYMMQIYNPTTIGARYVAYRNDALFNMVITEYNTSGGLAAKYTCMGCIATKIDAISMSFEAPSKVQSFGVTIKVEGITYS